ncbi:MAG: valine--tRNA ligase [Candidatus Diapherotrites archaeon]|nr:valine--tRNA ligase [Candidatus Diapherotrites archaeon]
MAIAEKTWGKELEKPIFENWKKKKLYAFKGTSKKPVFSIDTPPPYVNTPVHIGQATTYVLMDFFARFKRMTGHEVLFPLGLDRNGLPIEMAAEKRFKISPHSVLREEFMQKCKQVLEESSTESKDSFLKLGIGFNSWEEGKEIGSLYLTDSPEYRALTQGTFIDLWKKGLIYEDERITNYCPGCRTTIADSEVEYAEIASKFNDVKFKVKETGEDLIIGTTRPELICTIGMVIYNPTDDRYKHLEGKTAVSPIFGKEVPIKAHPYADPEKGTGIMMMCSAGDLTDIRFFREMDIKPVIAIGSDGKMNEHSGLLKGLRVREARQKMIEELRAKELLVGQKPVVHRTPICERSKDEIEFISMKEYYLKQLDFKDKMRELAKKVNFYSPKSRQILLDWIDSISIDWPISRRRYYATEIPLWYCKKCNAPILPEKGKYYQPWKDKPPIKKCPKCSATEFIGETRVFDTWFDSSISPLYILGYERQPAFFKKAFPCTVRPQGKEIVRTWLYYTLLKCHHLTGKCVFKDAWINYHIVDDKGNKMSKSKGNMIDPHDVLEKFGAEPFRLWTAIEGDLTKTDFRCSFDRIQGAQKTLVKLWNVARFISNFPKPKKAKLREIDNWIIQEMNEIIEFTRERYENYDFHAPAILLKNFLWETFASHYLEIAKGRAYNDNKAFSKEEQNGALQTLNYCLETMLKLWAPIIPFATHKLYSDLNRGKDIHFEKFPTSRKTKKIGFSTKELCELNSSIWKTKKDSGKGLRDEIKELFIPAQFAGIKKDLQSMHNAKKVSLGTKFEIKI